MTQPALTLSQAIEGRLLAASAKGLSANTIKEYTAYYRRLQRFYADAPDLPDDPPFVDIDVVQLQRFMLTQDHLSKKSRSNIRIALSSMWTWSIGYQLTAHNVAGDLDTIKPESRAIHAFTRDDVKSMLNCADRSKPYTRPGKRECTHHVRQALRNKAMIYLLLDTGLRSSELASLRLRDVDKKNQRLKVMGKGAKERIVPFSSITALAIWRYLATRPDARPEDPLLVTTRDRPLDNYGVRDVIAIIADRAGVPNAHPHRFRHTFAINFLRNGGNIYTLKEILGHASLKMCLRYLEIAQADVENNYRPASPVKNWGL
jgi:integrase/recombinase XerD